MKEWHDKGHLIDKLAEARKDARDTAPRSGGNDALEAAMLLGMLYALDKIHQEEDTSAATPSETSTAAASADQAEATPETPPAEETGPVTEDMPPAEPDNPEAEHPDPEQEHPHKGRRRGKHE